MSECMMTGVGGAHSEAYGEDGGQCIWCGEKSPERCSEKRYGTNQCLRDAGHTSGHADWMPEIGSERFNQGRPSGLSDEEAVRMWQRYQDQGHYPDPVPEE